LIEAAFAHRVSSRVQARNAIKRLEHERRQILTRFGETANVVAVIDQFMLVWAHRNLAYVTHADFNRFLNRAERHDPIGRAQRLFRLSALPQIARFGRVLKRHPAGVTDVMSRARYMRPLCEIELTDGVPEWFAAASGLRPGDDLIVHLGSTAYEGALVLASMDAPPQPPRKIGTTIVFAARLIKIDPAGSTTIRLRDGVEELEFAAGEIAVECVIFNRPEVLADLATN
jgi:hypothetical protein